MDPLQEQHERWVGDRAVEQYNTDHGTSFRFYGRAGEAPDLEYRENRSLRIEVLTAYYDKEDAKFKWVGARKRPDAPSKWAGVDFDKSSEFGNSRSKGLAFTIRVYRMKLAT